MSDRGAYVSGTARTTREGGAVGLASRMTGKRVNLRSCEGNGALKALDWQWQIGEREASGLDDSICWLGKLKRQ